LFKLYRLILLSHVYCFGLTCPQTIFQASAI